MPTVTDDDEAAAPTPTPTPTPTPPAKKGGGGAESYLTVLALATLLGRRYRRRTALAA